MKPVESLYKYVTAERIDVLQSLKIRYTQVSALNDPFEGLPAVIPTESRAEFRDAARDYVREEFRSRTVAKSLHPKKNKRKALQRLMKTFDQYEGIHAIEQYQARIRYVTETTTGMLCLSKTPNSILMWSHYANSHQGFLIEFDGFHPYFRYGTSEVVYSEVRPAVTLNATRPSAAIMTTKSLDWRYEQEVRRMENLVGETRKLPNGHSLVIAPKDLKEDPSRVHLFDFPAEIIKSVVLGWKSPPELREQIISALNASNLRHVRLKRAVPSQDHYRMEIISDERVS